MTVGELRQLLELYPADAPVVAREWVYDACGLYDVRGVCLREELRPERGVAIEVSEHEPTLV